MIPAKIEPDRDRLRTVLALVAAAPEDAEAVCAAHGVDPEAVLTALADPEILRGALVLADELRQSGELLKRKAVAPLERLVDQIADAVDAGDISPALAPRVAETLYKLSGIEAERAARARVAEPAEERPRVHILCDDDPVPDTGGKYAIIIRLPGHNREKVIDAEGECDD